MQYWAGPWSLLSCSYFCECVYLPAIKTIGAGLGSSVTFIREGKSTCYLGVEDKSSFGKVIAAADGKLILRMCSRMKSESDILRRLFRGKVTLQSYLEYVKGLENYYPAHIFVKNLPDYIDEVKLKRNFSKLEDARVYAEPMFSESEPFIQKVAEIVAAKTGLSKKNVLHISHKEMLRFMKTGKFPNKKILERRESCVLVFKKGNLSIDLDLTSWEKKVHKPSDNLKGSTAFPGKARGIAKIVLDPKKDFIREGQILVAKMTRPDFLPQMKKAAAFVTDAGGMLCHAAIVARELKKPCVVGTLNATKSIKDGDVVEVDADKGTVKKIS
jgi:phosphohistidine swiveling domain-containing protein